MIKDDCSNVKQVTGVILHDGAETFLIGLVCSDGLILRKPQIIQLGDEY